MIFIAQCSVRLTGTYSGRLRHTVTPSSPPASHSFVLPTLSDPTMPGPGLAAKAEVNETWFLSSGS